MIYRPQSAADRGRTPAELGVAPEIVTLDVDGKQHTVDKRQRRDRPLEGLRHPARRPQRLAATRGAPPGGFGLLDPRPRLDERLERQRTPQQRAKLENDDRITIGSTELLFGRSSWR